MCVCIRAAYNQNVIHLCLALPGTGKSHWLQSQNADIIGCTNKSHRAILCAIADAMGITYQSRASIDDLIALIMQAPPCTIALDDIDRTSPRISYTLLTLTTRHTILATATDRKRIKPLLDRQAAIIVPPPRADIRAILASRYPDLSPAAIRRISSVATTPAAAIHIAESVRAGQPLPQAPSHDWTPLIALAALAIIYLLRYQTDTPTTAAILLAVGYVVRRWMWRRT